MPALLAQSASFQGKTATRDRSKALRLNERVFKYNAGVRNDNSPDHLFATMGQQCEASGANARSHEG
jgi:hypothetical protein